MFDFSAEDIQPTTSWEMERNGSGVARLIRKGSGRYELLIIHIEPDRIVTEPYFDGDHCTWVHRFKAHSPRHAQRIAVAKYRNECARA